MSQSAGPIPLQIDVKNTFIHFDLPGEEVERDSISRRGASVPPSIRLAPSTKLPCAGDCKMTCIVSPLVRSDSSTDLSTEDPSSSDDDVVSVDSESRQGHLPQVSTLNGKDQLRTRLKATAKAWRPQPAVQFAAIPVIPQVMQTGQLAAEFLRRLATVASILVTAMNSGEAQAGSLGMRTAYAEESSGGWTVHLVTQFYEVNMQNQLLELAKDLLLNKAAKAGALCVLGSVVQWTSSGFVATLAELPDTTRACWGLYAKGCCRRGISCGWQHPERTASFQVVISMGGMR